MLTTRARGRQSSGTSELGDFRARGLQPDFRNQSKGTVSLEWNFRARGLQDDDDLYWYTIL